MDIFLYSVQQGSEFTVLALRRSQTSLFFIINEFICSNSCVFMRSSLNEVAVLLKGCCFIFINTRFIQPKY